VDLRYVLTATEPIWVGLDELVVESVTTSTVKVAGTMSSAYVRAVAKVDANGFERQVIFKSAANKVATLRAVPEPNWRGTGARLQVKRAGGVAAHSTVLGVVSEVQTVALRDTDATKANQGAGTGGTFTLTLSGESTPAIPWGATGATSAKVREELEKLSLVDQVTVERKPADGIATTAAYNYGYIYTCTFWGASSNANLPALSGRVDSIATGSIHFNTVVEGIAKATYLQQYVSLKENQKYTLRLAAANSEGYGPTSTEAAVSTPQVGVLPGSPRAVTLGSSQYTGTSLGLHFEEPVRDGGAEIVRYHIEWDSSSSFERASPNFG
jgi:hypothetical protein